MAGKAWRGAFACQRARYTPGVTVHSFFPTRVYAAPLLPEGGKALNDRLERECRQLAHDDGAGRQWSAVNYAGGYTSYGSANRMHTVSPTFAELERHLAAHVRDFSRVLGLDLRGRRLRMTDCWVNIMRHRAHHGLHLHPLSTLSGTYYVRVPRGSPGLKIEDPRLDRMMATPPRRADAEVSPWITLPATAGEILLFESWLRHEVVSNPSRTARISISFNYSWF